MREIVIDTETTGLDPASGHRVIEIAGVELTNHVATGRVFHAYVNPERDVPQEVTRIHGLTWERLQNEPLFKEMAPAFLDFIKDDTLIIHNAVFDMKFINAELERARCTMLPMERAVDTLLLARKRFPGAAASLDALCRRFAIDNSHRDTHGALIDAELLAEVYLELVGGRQPGFLLGGSKQPKSGGRAASRPYRAPRPHAPTPEEIVQHRAFIAAHVHDPLWAHIDGWNAPPRTTED